MTLALRLALVVAGLIALLLLGLGAYLEAHVAASARTTLDAELASHADAIAHGIEIDRGGDVDAEDAVDAAGGHAFRVETEAGAVLFSSTATWPGASGGPGTAEVHDTAGAHYVVLTRRFTPEHADRHARGPLLLRVAARSTQLDELVARFRTGLAVALVAGLVLAIAAALALAYASLRPLRRLARDVAAIEATALGSRIEEADLPRDLRPLAASFNGLLGRVDAALRRQRSFVARASHGLRTPTAGILARAEVALRRERSDAEYRAALTDVVAAGHESAAIISQLLATLRADEVDRPLRLEPIVLAEVAGEARRLFEPRATVAGVTMEWDVPPSATIRADHDALRELLDALLDNALRYTPAGGALGVRVQVLAGATLVEVWDTGPGIPVAERTQVFEHFYRGAAAEATGATGAGLGLAICHAIVTAHRASIEIDDNPGGGTVVRVCFPDRRGPPQTA